MNMNMAEALDEKWDWTADLEVSLFHSMKGHKPFGKFEDMLTYPFITSNCKIILFSIYINLGTKTRF